MNIVLVLLHRGALYNTFFSLFISDTTLRNTVFVFKDQRQIYVAGRRKPTATLNEFDSIHIFTYNLLHTKQCLL